MQCKDNHDIPIHLNDFDWCTTVKEEIHFFFFFTTNVQKCGLLFVTFIVVTAGTDRFFFLFFTFTWPARFFPDSSQCCQ